MPPFLLPFAGLLAGILAGQLQPGLIWPAVLAATALVIAAAITACRRNPTLYMKAGRFNHVWIALLFLSAGWMEATQQKPFEYPFQKSSPFLKCEAEILTAEAKAEYDRYTVEVRKLVTKEGGIFATDNFRAIVTTPGTLANVGDIIEIPARFRRITNRPGYTFDYAGRMRDKGILYRQHVNPQYFKVTGSEHGLHRLCAEWHDRLVVAIEKSGLSRDNRALAIAMLCGDRSYLPEELSEAFASTGIAHVLAVSGLHIGIVAAIILWLLFPLNLFGLYKLRFVVAAAAAWVFTLMAGAPASAVRAAVMTSFCFAAYALERRNSSLNALLAAAFLILLVDCHAAYDIGAQLSFTCVAALIIFAGRLNPADHHAHPWLYNICGIVIVSIVATAATWALTSHYFGLIPMMFLPVNLIAVPLIPIYIAGVLVYLAVTALGIDVAALALPTDIITEALTRGSRLVADMPGSVIEYQTTPMVVALWSALLLGAAIAIVSRRA